MTETQEMRFNLFYPHTELTDEEQSKIRALQFQFLEARVDESLPLVDHIALAFTQGCVAMRNEFLAQSSEAQTLRMALESAEEMIILCLQNTSRHDPLAHMLDKQQREIRKTLEAPAQSSEITAERDRLRELINSLLFAEFQPDMFLRVSPRKGKATLGFYRKTVGDYIERATPYEALTAYLKGKGDGDKGE